MKNDKSKKAAEPVSWSGWLRAAVALSSSLAIGALFYLGWSSSDSESPRADEEEASLALVPATDTPSLRGGLMPSSEPSLPDDLMPFSDSSFFDDEPESAPAPDSEALTAPSRQLATGLPPGLDVGLEAYYKFDGGFTDASGKGRTLDTGMSSYSFDVPNRLGENGKTVSLNGYRARGTQPCLMTTRFTLSIWVKPAVNAALEFMSQKENMGYPCTGKYVYYCLYGSSTRNIHLNVKTGDYYDNPTIYSAASLYQVNQWQHLAAQFDSGAGFWKIFYNNRLDASGIHTKVLVPDGGVCNKLFLGSDLFSGRMDEATIHNRILSDSEISYLYHRLNLPPAFPTISSLIVDNGAPILKVINASDPDVNDVLTYSLARRDSQPWPSVLTKTLNTGTIGAKIQGTWPMGPSAYVPLRATVTDGWATDSRDFDLTVDIAPEILVSPMPLIAGFHGEPLNETISPTVSFDDPNPGDALRSSLIVPAGYGLSYSPDDSRLMGSPTFSDYRLEHWPYTVTDPYGLTSSQSLPIVFNNEPPYSRGTFPGLFALENQESTLTVPYEAFGDTHNVYRMSVYPAGSGNFSFGWNTTAMPDCLVPTNVTVKVVAPLGSYGTYPITVHLDDCLYGRSSFPFDLTIDPAPRRTTDRLQESAMSDTARWRYSLPDICFDLWGREIAYQPMIQIGDETYLLFDYDAGTGLYTWSVFSFDPETKVFSATFTAGYRDTYYIKVMCFTPQGGTNHVMLEVTCNNYPTEFVGHVDDVSATAQRLHRSIVPEAAWSDRDDAHLFLDSSRYGADLPKGMALDRDTHELVGIPTEPGVQPVTIISDDGHGSHADSNPVTAAVLAAPPEVSAFDPVLIPEAEPTTISIPRSAVKTPSGGDVTMTLQKADGSPLDDDWEVAEADEVTPVAKQTLDARGGRSSEVILRGSVAFVFDPLNGVHLYNRTASGALDYNATYPLPGVMRGVLKGPHVIAARGRDGLGQLDFTKPPEEQTIVTRRLGSSVDCVDTYGDYVYFTQGMDGFGVIPYQAFSEEEPNIFSVSGTCRALLVIDDYLFVGVWNKEVQVYSLAINPEVPQKLGTFPIEGSLSGFSVYGDYLFMARGSFIQVLNMQNKGNLLAHTMFIMPGEVTKISVPPGSHHAYVFIKEQGLIGIDLTDIADTSKPQKQIFFHPMTGTLGGDVLGNEALIATGYFGSGLIEETAPGLVASVLTGPDKSGQEAVRVIATDAFGQSVEAIMPVIYDPKPIEKSGAVTSFPAVAGVPFDERLDLCVDPRGGSIHYDMALPPETWLHFNATIPVLTGMPPGGVGDRVRSILTLNLWCINARGTKTLIPVTVSEDDSPPVPITAETVLSLTVWDQVNIAETPLFTDSDEDPVSVTLSSDEFYALKQVFIEAGENSVHLSGMITNQDGSQTFSLIGSDGFGGEAQVLRRFVLNRRPPSFTASYPSVSGAQNHEMVVRLPKSSVAVPDGGGATLTVTEEDGSPLPETFTIAPSTLSFSPAKMYLPHGVVKDLVPFGQGKFLVAVDGIGVNAIEILADGSIRELSTLNGMSKTINAVIPLGRYAWVLTQGGGAYFIQTLNDGGAVQLSMLYSWDDFSTFHDGTMMVKTGYFAAGSSGLIKVDFSNRDHPVVIARSCFGATSCNAAVVTHHPEGYVFVGDGSKIWVVKDRVGGAFDVQRFIETSGQVTVLVWRNNQLYVGAGDHVFIYVLEASGLVPIKEGQVPGVVTGLSLDGSDIHVSDNLHGVTVLYAGEGTELISRGDIKTPGTAYGVHVYGSHSLTLDSRAGVSSREIQEDCLVVSGTPDETYLQDKRWKVTAETASGSASTLVPVYIKPAPVVEHPLLDVEVMGGTLTSIPIPSDTFLGEGSLLYSAELDGEPCLVQMTGMDRCGFAEFHSAPGDIRFSVLGMYGDEGTHTACVIVSDTDNTAKACFRMTVQDVSPRFKSSRDSLSMVVGDRKTYTVSLEEIDNPMEKPIVVDADIPGSADGWVQYVRDTRSLFADPKEEGIATVTFELRGSERDGGIKRVTIEVKPEAVSPLTVFKYMGYVIGGLFLPTLMFVTNKKHSRAIALMQRDLRSLYQRKAREIISSGFVELWFRREELDLSLLRTALINPLGLAKDAKRVLDELRGKIQEAFSAEMLTRLDFMTNALSREHKITKDIKEHFSAYYQQAEVYCYLGEGSLLSMGGYARLVELLGKAIEFFMRNSARYSTEAIKACRILSQLVDLVLISEVGREATVDARFRESLLTEVKTILGIITEHSEEITVVKYWLERIRAAALTMKHSERLGGSMRERLERGAAKDNPIARLFDAPQPWLTALYDFECRAVSARGSLGVAQELQSKISLNSDWVYLYRVIYLLKGIALNTSNEAIGRAAVLGGDKQSCLFFKERLMGLVDIARWSTYNPLVKRYEQRIRRAAIAVLRELSQNPYNAGKYAKQALALLDVEELLKKSRRLPPPLIEVEMSSFSVENPQRSDRSGAPASPMYVSPKGGSPRG